MNYNVFLIRYSEIGLKSEQVRKKIEQILKKNIHFKLKKKIKTFEIKVLPARGRIFIYTDEIKKTTKQLSRIFGIDSFSPARECSSDYQDIKSNALALASTILKKGDSFAIKTRRTGRHDYSSREISEKIGAAVLDHVGRDNITVKLKNPKKTIFIEIRDQFTYIFDEKIKGLGGFPYKAQPKLVSLILNEFSLLSTWLMLRKGCEIVPVFLLEDGLSKKTLNLIPDVTSSVKKYLPVSKWPSYLVDIKGFLDKKNLKEITHYLLQHIIEKENAYGLVRSDIIIDNIENSEKITVPIYRPLLFLGSDQIQKFKTRFPLKIKLEPPVIPHFKNYKPESILSEEDMSKLNLDTIIYKEFM